MRKQAGCVLPKFLAVCAFIAVFVASVEHLAGKAEESTDNANANLHQYVENNLINAKSEHCDSNDFGKEKGHRFCTVITEMGDQIFVDCSARPVKENSFGGGDCKELATRFEGQ